ncbi:MAG: hypothetical protein GF320_14010 [Armatimonadia bacterium]|nr:hypothetical protein [Armatimonadia bacterium]
MARIERGIEHTSGIPLGGIGTGSVEIREDGLFHDWLVFNLGQWSPQSPTPECQSGDASRGPAMTPHDLTFILRTETASGGVQVRRLALREALNNLYSLAWAKCVQSIRYDGRFPLVELEYLDDTLPVRVTATIFAPFVPHDARASGTPGFCVDFRIESGTDEPVTASILGTLGNPVRTGAHVHELATDADSTYVTLGVEGVGEDDPCNGSLTFGLTGGSRTVITGAYEQERGSLLTFSDRYGGSSRCYLFEFRERGELTSCMPRRALEPFPEGFEPKALTASQREEALARVLDHSFFQAKWQRIRDAEPRLLEGEEAICEFLADVAKESRQHLADPLRWRDALLCGKTQVDPGQAQELRFTVAWHYPNHISQPGRNIGHRYECFFEDSLAVARHLAAEHDSLRETAAAFAEALYDSTLDPAAAEAIGAQLTTIPKCTWWTKAGDFGVWEGLGCCGFHTTDITYQGSFSLLALFPELQKGQMMMSGRFQREDGRIPHMFHPDFSQTDDQFERVDMSPQFVLLVARDYLWTADVEYVRGLWEPIVKAIEDTALLDADGDGLPDHGCERQTYDVWNLYGCPSYIASLWVSALKAAAFLAEELGDDERARRWREWHGRAVESFEKLWNGEYYVLWKEMLEGGRVDEACMSDQIDGEWFTSLVGWGPSLPLERIRAALAAIYRYNFREEDGLLNASYPPGKPRRISTYGTLQFEVPWTGIEYAIASMLIDFGMPDEGLAVVRNIEDRYRRAGRLWNHLECGGHYYRAMSSWALLLALTGFRVDAARGALTVEPAQGGDLRSLYVTSFSWGVIELTGDRFSLRCLGGEERIAEIRVAGLAEGAVAAEVDGAKAEATTRREDGMIVAGFDPPVTLAAGTRLELRVE